MMKLLRLTMLMCLWVCFVTDPALACRYNVRETGFVDLGTEPYYLYGYVSKDTPAEITSAFKQISYAALMDSNIRVEIINTSRQLEHLAIKYPDLWQIKTFPAAVLVSPDGQSVPVCIIKPDKTFEETLRESIEDIVSSPKRQEILQQVIKTYGVVLLIEGTDAEENKRAKAAASGAIKRISMQMEMMPKPIAHPPVIIVIDSESLAREKVLLWSLGLDAGKVNEPYAVVFYGRARWIGPLFKGEEITENNLAAVLFVIGDDCECGLNQRWIQGTMLPARWNQKMQAEVAKNLGFDPENPMVKIEINRIVRIGSASYPGVPIGYQPLVKESEPAFVNEPNRAKPSWQPVTPAQSKAIWQKPLYFVVGLTTLIIAVGLFIVLRAGRRKP